MLGIGAQGLFEMLDRQRPLSPHAVDAAHFVQAGAPPAILPCGVREQRIGCVEISLQALQSRELVDRFGVGGIVVAHLQPGDGAVEVLARIVKQPLFHAAAPHGEVAPQILRIAPQRLHVVVLGHKCVVLVLLEVCAVQVQRFKAFDLGGFGRNRPLLRPRLLSLRPGLPCDQRAAVLAGELRADAGLCGSRRQWEFAQHGMVGIDRHAFLPNRFAAHGDAKDCALMPRRRRKAEFHCAILHGHRHRRIAGGVYGDANFRHRIPDHRKDLRFAGQNVGKIGLVVGKDASHQLDIAIAVVRQIGAPRAAKIAVAPRPHLLARGDMVIRDGDCTRFRGKVVAAEEIHVALPAGNHHRRRQLDVGKPRRIHAVAVIIGAGRPELPLHHRKRNDRAPVVVARPFDVRRKYGLVVLVHAHGQIVPPHERQRRIGAVVDHRFYLDQRTSRIDGDARHAAHAVEGLRLAHPAGHGAVGILDGRRLRRHKRSRPVMLRPVEFDAAGHPRPGQPDHGRLDAYVAVDEFIAIALQHRSMDFSTQFRQAFNRNILILQRHHVVSLHHGHIAQLIRVRQGINSPRRPLIGLFLDKKRQFVGLSGDIGGDLAHLAPHCDSHVHSPFCRQRPILILSARWKNAIQISVTWIKRHLTFLTDSTRT